MLRDEKLIRRLQRRWNAKEADEIVRMYYDELYIYAYRQTGDKHTAMDVTQEIFISMLASLHGYDPKKSGFRTWLYRIATNKIIDYRRKNRAIIVDIDEVAIAEDADFVNEIADREFLRKIEEYVAKSEAEGIFRMRVHGGMSFADIGNALGIPENTAKTKYHRLVKKIREEFYHEYKNADG